MAIKVKVDFDAKKIFQKIKKLNSNEVLNKIGDDVVEEIKANIAVGLSPVLNEGRFEAYSSQRNATSRFKAGYPFSVQKKYPNKTMRPVNLHLSGDMLEALTNAPRDGRIVIGIFNGEQAAKAQQHQLGDEKKGLPRRRFLPTANGEKFTVGITRRILELYSKALDAIIKKSND